MSTALAKLITLCQVAPLGNGVYQGENQDLGLPQIFGGQLMAQALSAAMAQVEPTRAVHALHVHFWEAGQVNLPVIYETAVQRAGRSFSVVAVEAKQADKTLLHATVSFHALEQSVTHQAQPPRHSREVAKTDETALRRQIASSLPSPLRDFFAQEPPFEVHTQFANSPFQGQVLPPEQTLWVKTNGSLVADPRLHACLLAYFSDFHCIATMLHPHGIGVLEQKIRFATLNHSIWFHRHVDMQQGVHIELNAPISHGGRGFSRAEVFDAQGNLLASYVQEGLLRTLTSPV